MSAQFRDGENHICTNKYAVISSEVVANAGPIIHEVRHGGRQRVLRGCTRDDDLEIDHASTTAATIADPRLSQAHLANPAHKCGIVVHGRVRQSSRPYESIGPQGSFDAIVDEFRLVTALGPVECQSFACPTVQLGRASETMSHDMHTRAELVRAIGDLIALRLRGSGLGGNGWGVGIGFLGLIGAKNTAVQPQQPWRRLGQLLQN